MKTPLTPIEYVERERELLLARRGRRAVMPLVQRLILMDDDDLAVEVLRVGIAHGVTLPEGRTVDEERALLRRVLDALRPHVRSYTERELAASSAFHDFLEAWTAPVN
jgi:hypothetical protein